MSFGITHYFSPASSSMLIYCRKHVCVGREDKIYGRRSNIYLWFLFARCQINSFFFQTCSPGCRKCRPNINSTHCPMSMTETLTDISEKKLPVIKSRPVCAHTRPRQKRGGRPGTPCRWSWALPPAQGGQSRSSTSSMESSLRGWWFAAPRPFKDTRPDC